MDFVVGLPTTRKKNDHIFIMVDQFGKMAIFAAYKITINACKVVELFLLKLLDIMGDRVPCFRLGYVFTPKRSKEETQEKARLTLRSNSQSKT
jgi:hypothetical protein